MSFGSNFHCDHCASMSILVVWRYVSLGSNFHVTIVFGDLIYIMDPCLGMAECELGSIVHKCDHCSSIMSIEDPL